MKAFGYLQGHTLENFAVKEIELPTPELRELDVLVHIKATSLNPVDTKIRKNRSGEKPVVLGWDAAGVIEKVGTKVQDYKIGDEVYYAGDITRAGTNAALQAVDSRIIAKKPASLDFTQAAALPLTALTAWEGLFEKGIQYSENTSVLIFGGAGGVGSIAIQLLKAKTKAKVIGTASRPETVAWVKEMGADLVIDHTKDIEQELKRVGVSQVDVIYSTTNSEENAKLAAKILRPFGHFILIDDPKSLDIMPLKSKAISVHWEFMFAKSMHAHNEISQHEILKAVASLVSEGKLRSTAHTILNGLTVENLKKGHTLQESGRAIGKIVIVP